MKEKAMGSEDIDNFVFKRLEAVKIVLEKKVLLRHISEGFGATSADISNAIRIGRSNTNRALKNFVSG